MISPWYRTGTVTVVNGSTQVTGAGTLFVINAISAGDVFFAPDGLAYEVDSVQNDTQLTLKTAYAGASFAAQDYSIVRFVAQSPIKLAALLVDKTVAWDELIDQHAMYLSGNANSTVTAPENLCVNYSLGEVKTDISEANCPTGFTFVASGASLSPGWFLFNDTVGNFRVAKHPETFKDEITALKEAAESASSTVQASSDLINTLDIRTFKPSVNPILDLDFANQEYSEYEAPTGKTSKLLADVLDVTNGSASYTDPTGMTRTISANTARLTYNAETGVSEGLLVEERRINYRKYANQFAKDIEAGTLTSENAVFVSVDEPTIFGQLNGVKISNTDSLTAHQASFNSNSVPDNSTYCSSFIAEMYGECEVLNVSNGFFANHETRGYVSVNLVTGQVVEESKGTGTGTISAYVKHLGNSIYHVAICGAVTTDNSGSPVNVHTYIQPRKSDNVSNYVGDSQSGVIVHYHWVEVGSFPSSPIPDATIFNSRASTGTYYDSTGALQTAADNVARYSYNPANLKAEPALLLEEARTNLLFPSDMSTHSDLGYTRSTITGLDGVSNSALRLTEDTTTAQRRLRDATSNAVSLSTGDILTMSMFVKPNGDRDNILLLLGLTGDVPESILVEFALSDKSYSDVSIPTHTFIHQGIDRNYRDGWVRLYFTVELTSNVTAVSGWLFFSNSFGDGNATYAGDGSSYIDVFGMQIEQGSYPTSYIPTTTSAVTRAADVSTGVQAVRLADNVTRDLSTLDGWNSNEFSLFFQLIGNNEGGNNPHLFSISDNTSSNLFRAYKVSANAVKTTNYTLRNAVSGVTNSLLTIPYDFKKLVIIYDGVTVKAFADGILLGNQAVSAVVGTKLNIGSYFTGAFNLNDSLKSFQARPRALSQAEAIALTS